MISNRILREFGGTRGNSRGLSGGRFSNPWRRFTVLAVLVLSVAGCWLRPPALPAPTPARLTGAMATPTTPAPTPTQTPQVPSDQLLAMVPAAAPTVGRLARTSHYEIWAEVDPEALTYRGRLHLSYVNAEDVALDALYFRLFPNAQPIYGGGELRVTEAQVDGQPVSAKVGDDPTVLKVALGREVPPDGRATVELAFEGRIPRDFGEEQQGYGIFNASDELITMADFYPVLAVYNEEGWNLDPVYPEGDAVFSDVAFFTVHVTVPEGWEMVSSGVETGRELAPEGRLTYTCATGPVREFFLALSPELHVTVDRVEYTKVNSHWFNGDEKGGQRALEVAVKALETFTADFGPYPYRELDVVETDLNLAAGVEYPGVILTGSEYYSGNNQVLELATAHEVAHQWWYGVVGNDVIDTPWLDEALAQYSTLLYFESAYGRSRYDQVRQAWQRAVDKAVEEGRDDVVGSPMSHWAGRGDAYGLIVYLKGPLFFHALREQVGDETFFQILRRYYQTYAYGIATPEGFLQVAEEVSGVELDELYEEWILSARRR